MNLSRPNPIRYTRPQRLAMLFLLAMIIGTEIFGYFILSDEGKAEELVQIPSEVLALQSEAEKPGNEYSGYGSEVIEKFNPNELNAQQWQELGFSPKQVQTILKYKNSLGGYFSSKEQIQNCYVISDQKFAEIEPYIVFGDLTPASGGVSISRNDYLNKAYRTTAAHYVKFNPNSYRAEDWQKIGFSERQAGTILKYKALLGGKFTSLEQIRNCYVISDEKFLEMKPFIILTEGDSSTVKEIPQTQDPVPAGIRKFNPDNLTREDWEKLGFSERQINTIFNYKKSLGGKFKDAETLRKCYSISAGKFSEIEPYLDFNMN